MAFRPEAEFRRKMWGLGFRRETWEWNLSGEALSILV